MKKYFQGEESLAKTIWLFWVAGSLILAILGSVVVYAAGFIFQFPSNQIAFITFLSLMLFNPYYVVCWIAAWRATQNTTFQAAAIGVKVLVAFHVAYVISGLLHINELVQNGI